MEVILFLAFIVFVPGICYWLWKMFLLFVSPEAYRDTIRHDHEKEMARQARNQQALGIFGTLARIFLK